MPRRTTFRRNQEPQPGEVPPHAHTAPPRPRKSRWGWLKWVGGISVGAIVGAKTMDWWRKYEAKAEGEAGGNPGPQQNPAPGAGGPGLGSVVPFPTLVPMPMAMPMMPGFGGLQQNPRTEAYYRGNDNYETLEARREQRAEARAKRQEKIFAMLTEDDD